MGDLPSSNNGPVLGQIPNVTAVNPQAYSPAPALATLQELTRQGKLSASDVMGAISQGLQLKVQRAQAQNAPAAADLQAAQIQAAKSALPAITAADIAGAQATTAQAQPVIAAAPGNTSAAQSASDIAATQAKFQKMAYDQDPSGTLASNTSLFSQFGVPPPMKPDGSLDADTINGLAAPIKSSMLMWQTPAAKAAMDLAGKKVGGWDLLMKNASNPGSAVSKLSDLPDNLPANDQQSTISTMAQIEATLSPDGPLAEARKLVNDPKLNAVGPQWNAGSEIGQKTAEAGAFLGGNTAKYDAQNRLNTTLASGVLNTIKSFAGSGAGAIRTAEIEWFEKNQPTLKSTPAYWNTWLDRADADLRQVYGARSKYLPGAVSSEFQTPPALPSAPGASKSSSAPVLVTSQAQYDALPSGTPVQSPDGKTGVKP